MPQMHWTPLRKAQLIEEIVKGTVSCAEAQTVHNISDEELVQWLKDYRDGGVKALRIRHQPNRNVKTVRNDFGR